MPPNQTTLQRIANGESRTVRDHAVHECMKLYGALVWHIARRWSRTPADAEDATQEIFLDVWRSAGRFDPMRGSDKIFITMIAKRRLIDRLRKLRTEPIIDSLESLDRDDWPADPGIHSDRNAEAGQAGAALATLREPHRQILELSLLQGLSQSAIATRLGIPLGTVKSGMRRGLIRVRELLEVAALLESRTAA